MMICAALAVSVGIGSTFTALKPVHAAASALAITAEDQAIERAKELNLIPGDANVVEAVKPTDKDSRWIVKFETPDRDKYGYGTKLHTGQATFLPDGELVAFDEVKWHGIDAFPA